jgi:hypothetical protein
LFPEKLKIQRQATWHGLENGALHRDTVRWGQLLKALGENHPGACDRLVRDHHLTECNSNADLRAKRVAQRQVLFRVLCLENQCCGDRIRSSPKPGHQGISPDFTRLAPKARHDVGHTVKGASNSVMRNTLVLLHQRGRPNDVGMQDNRKYRFCSQ